MTLDDSSPSLLFACPFAFSGAAAGLDPPAMASSTAAATALAAAGNETLLTAD